MCKQIRKWFAGICILTVLMSTMCGAAQPAMVRPVRAPDAPIVIYSEIPIILDGENVGVGLNLDSVAYVPLLSLCRSLFSPNCRSDWDSETETVVISSDGLEIKLTVGESYFSANGRYAYLHNKAYNINGSVVVPIRDFAPFFGVSVEWNRLSGSIILDSALKEIPEDGDGFYDETDLYWLSRVIYSESGNQPIEGMIGVGNVVLNRLNDDSGVYPDTVKDVIFQPGQFSVVERKAIYMPPNEESVIAAKLCLEGYNTVGKSKFFFNPDLSEGSWIKTYYVFYTSIGNHDFYA